MTPLKRNVLFALIAMSCHIGAMPFFEKCDALRFLSGDASEHSKIVVETYKKILDELGEGELTPPVLAEMRKQGNPFQLPASLTLKSTTLQKSLDEFKEILALKFPNGPSFEKELLESLEATAKSTEEQENRQSRNNSAAVDFIKTIHWKKAVHKASKYGKWFVAPAKNFSNVNSKNHSIYFHDGKKEVERSVPMKGDDFIPYQNELRPGTGDLYFSLNEPFRLMKMGLFDDTGKPLQKLKVERVALKGNFKGVTGTYNFAGFSPDGNHLLLSEGERLTQQTLHFGTVGQNEVTLRPLGKHEADPTEQAFGFMGNHSVYVQITEKKLKILPIDPTYPERVITLPTWVRVFTPNSTGTALHALSSNIVNNSLDLYAWDLAAPPTKALKPRKLTLRKAKTNAYNSIFKDYSLPLSNGEFVHFESEENVSSGNVTNRAMVYDAGSLALLRSINLSPWVTAKIQGVKQLESTGSIIGWQSGQVDEYGEDVFEWKYQ